MQERNVNMLRVLRRTTLVEKYILTGWITDEDLMNIFLVCDKNSNYGLISPKTKKEVLLKDIYNSPFILCDIDCLSSNIKKLLPNLLSYRYEQEKAEINYLYSINEISKCEYQKKLDDLKYYYYESTMDGKNILETGKCIGITDNVLKLKKA